MRLFTHGRAANLAFGVCLAVAAFLSVGTSDASAQENAVQDAAHQHAAHAESNGPNGGTVQTIDGKKVETIIREKGIMFRVTTADGESLPVKRGSGTLVLRVGDSDKEYKFSLKPMKNEMLGVGVDLSKVKGHTLHLDVQLESVTDSTLQFHSMGKVADEGLSDALLISLQKTCPVSGQKLGSMGKPPKVQLGDKSLFVCCAGCINKVKASPEQYLTKYYESQGEEIRPGVFEATLADAEAIAKQKICPVMDEPLGGMGTPGKVNVKGKAVYICCAGCAKKLAAEPDKYLALLKEHGVTPPDFK